MRLLLFESSRGPARAQKSSYQLVLIKPPRAPDLTPQPERPTEFDTDDEPRLPAPSGVQHHAQDAGDAQPGVPEADVRIFSVCAPIRCR